VHDLLVDRRPLTVVEISGNTLVIDEPILTTSPHVGTNNTLISVIREPMKPRKTTPRVGRYELITTDPGNAIQIKHLTLPLWVGAVYSEPIHWDELAGDNWATLSGIIADPQMVKCIMRLTASDINQLDFARSVWVSRFGAYFFLSFVNQFRADVVDSTEVELVKLPNP
jgi:hypothetical protein